MGLPFNKFGYLNIYFIWYIQAFNFWSEPYLKDFWTSQLELEMVKLYKNKVKFTYEQALFYPLTGGFIYKQRILELFFTVLLI